MTSAAPLSRYAIWSWIVISFGFIRNGYYA
jgi:hypothetical protein